MKLYKRKIFVKIEPFIKRKEAIIIKGMRRTGKTTLLRLLENDLIGRLKISKKNIYFFDLEELSVREDFNANPRNLLNYISAKKEKQYIFIDEIQYLDKPANFIKILVDHFPNLKIFATGSSSLDIKQKIQDSLIGRAIYFHLRPLNFFEFLIFKQKRFSLKVTPNQKNELEVLLKEYLKFGGMPEIVLEQNKNIKKELLKNYVNLYVSKDIRNLVEIGNIGSFNKLIKILSGQAGSLLDKNEISNTLDIAFKTLNRYLDILQHTYIIILLHPFFANLRSKLTKTPKIYFYDIGIRNSVLNDFNSIDFRIDKGALFENFILLELLSIFNSSDIFFYRTAKQTEIDFIVESEKIAVEVKCKKYKNRRIFRVFDSFKNFDNQIVNLNFNEKLKYYDFIDWWHFLNKIKNREK
ncbi:MAG: ATP-binding protein [Patescibacteria group bacterium]|nr:ATP-binding protein [Patescibacteria group bacterium]